MMATLPHIIFVEDDEALRSSVVQALELEGFTVSAHDGGQSALREIAPDMAAVVISDVRMPGMDGIELFARIRQVDPQIPVIFTTAHGDVDLAVEAMREGAADFFTKPYAISRIARAVLRAAEQRALVLENRQLRCRLENRPIDGWIGVSSAAERLQRTIKEVARTNADVLLAGATGTGKSHLARLIHDHSERADRPLVVVDPGIFANAEADLLFYGRDPGAALSHSGMVERASGGTLVLENIEEIPLAAQARLISLLDARSFYAVGALRPRKVDIRVVGTTRRDPDIAGSGSTASGLLGRLAGVTITLPVLAERKQDVPVFFREFVHRYERELDRHTSELSEADLRHLLTHDWPGNLRELRVFAQNFALGLTQIARLSPIRVDQPGLRELLAIYENSLLENALRTTGGSIQDVQQQLALPRKTLYDKMARYGLRPADFRSLSDLPGSA